MKALIPLVLALSGCALSPIGSVVDMHRPPPADYPKLKPYLFQTTYADAQKRCDVPAFMPITGCVLTYYELGECYIITSVTSESLPYVIEHELKHCEGYSHIGSNEFAARWKKFKADNRVTEAQ